MNILERRWTGKNETHPHLQVNSAILTQPTFCIWKNKSIVLSCYRRFESEKNWKMLYARKEKVKSSSQQKATYFDVHRQKGFSWPMVSDQWAILTPMPK